MDRNFALEWLFVTEWAAIAAACWRGRGDKKAADRAATSAMRKAFRRIAIRGTIGAAEGVIDGCSKKEMLLNGERVGRWGRKDPLVDIAADPLEFTTHCAEDGPDAFTVIAFAKDGGFLNAPDMYMNKLAVGPEAAGAVDIRRGVTWNLGAVAEAKKLRVADLTATLLKRERHEPIVAEIRKLKARVRLLPGGDLMAAINTALPDSGIDILFGSGGAPEGVLAAAALRCLGGDFQAVLMPENAEEARLVRRMTGRSVSHVYRLMELARGHVMFAATGVTDGSAFKGVRFHKDGAVTHSIVTRSKTGSFRHIENRHRADQIAHLLAPT